MFTFLEKASTTLSPTLYLLTIFSLLLGLGTALFVAYKVITLILKTIDKKKLKFNKDGVELDDSGNPQAIETANVPEITETAISFSEKSIVTLVYELNNIFADYLDSKLEIKNQTMEDQLKKFDSERKVFIFEIQGKYLNAIPKKMDVNNSYTMLFHYWFTNCFKDTDSEIKSILDRNHLKEKTADEYNDIINQLFDTTYSMLLSCIEECPSFIVSPDILKKIITDNKNSYRTYLDHSLQNAKKISEKAAEKRALLEQDLHEKESEIIKRNFPTVDIESILNTIGGN